MAAVTSCEHALLRKAYVHPNCFAFLFVDVSVVNFFSPRQIYGEMICLLRLWTKSHGVAI